MGGREGGGGGRRRTSNHSPCDRVKDKPFDRLEDGHLTTVTGALSLKGGCRARPRSYHATSTVRVNTVWSNFDLMLITFELVGVPIW
jgi:hypothetical protein